MTINDVRYKLIYDNDNGVPLLVYINCHVKKEFWYIEPCNKNHHRIYGTRHSCNDRIKICKWRILIKIKSKFQCLLVLIVAGSYKHRWLFQNANIIQAHEVRRSIYLRLAITYVIFWLRFLRIWVKKTVVSFAATIHSACSSGFALIHRMCSI